MTRSRMGFLPLFFAVLAVAFGMALWFRIRSYSTAETETNQGKSFGRTASVSEPPAIAMPSASETIDDAQSTQRAQRTSSGGTPSEWKIVDGNVATTTVNGAQPAQPPPAKPSLFSRVVTPIVNAITGGAPKVQQPASSAPARNPQPASSKPENNDRSSDTQVPQLLAISFNPPQVRDGEETVLFVQAIDDLSGIRSISGTIAAPSGAVQGFALQRELESDRYIAHITVPKDAAEGVWRVNYLSLIDNASNAATISGVQGALPPTASFRVVSSRSDATGPALKAIWIERHGMKAGEKVRLFVDADDDKSGVNLVSGVFVSPSKHARIGFVCRAGNGPWECELTTPACIDCGDWQLEQVQLQDKANNMTTIRSDNPLVANLRVNITSDRCDVTPPALLTLVLDRPVVPNVEDGVINVSASTSDDVCGVMSISGQVTGPSTAGGAPRLYFSFTPADQQTWIGRISVPRLAAKGAWRISWIQVLDQAHNLRTYSSGDPALANAVFTVQ